MTSSLIASAMSRNPLYHIECLTAPPYTKYPILSPTGSQCPDDNGWLLSIAGLTDIAITRVHPRKPSGSTAVGWLSRRRPAAEVLLARHQRPTDARQLVGQRDRHHLARLDGEQLGDPRIAPDALAFDQRCRTIDQEPAQIAVAALADRAQP